MQMSAVRLERPPAAPPQPPPQLTEQELAEQKEAKAKLLEAASKAALEIRESLVKKGKEPTPEPAGTKPKSAQVCMGVVIHWSGQRGFGILRSQTLGEVFVHAKSLVNVTDLELGDVVTFELGYDPKKNKPEAIQVCKAGVGGHQVPPTAAAREEPAPPVFVVDEAASGPTVPALTAGPAENGGAAPVKPVDDALLAGAAAAAALKLLAQGLGSDGPGTFGGSKRDDSSSSRSRSRRRKRSRSRGRRRR